MFREQRAFGEAPREEALEPGHDHGLQALLQSPLYQVRRVLRVTQTHWDLPLARGKRAARLARRVAPLMAPPRPGAIAMLAG